ncbi:MAG: hypothetical protein JW841_14760 [Deltaproteobacteria bacterium]|nr:hypothetical protein [Deltaproteobacteria bacterium]
MSAFCMLSRFMTRRLFVTRQARKSGMFWRHLQRCQSCATYYDKMMMLERHISAPNADAITTPADLEFSVVLESVLKKTRASTITANKLQFPHLRILIPAVASAAVALVAVIMLYKPTTTNDTWTVRDAGSNNFAIRAFCETKDVNGQVTINSLSETADTNNSTICANGGIVRFAYIAKQEGTLTVFAINSANKVISIDSIISSIENSGPWHLATASTLTPLSFSIDKKTLTPNSELLTIRLLFIFGTSAIELHQIQSCDEQHHHDFNTCALLHNFVVIERKFSLK